MIPVRFRESRISTPVWPNQGRWLVFCLLLLTVSVLLTVRPTRAEEDPRRLEFRGRVVLPERTLSWGQHLSLTLFGVESPFVAQTSARAGREFRFRNLYPGTYSLSIHVPRAGEILQTIVITPSFADEKGRVEKTFLFDEQSLRSKARPIPRGMVSVRELSISAKARKEYQEAQKRLQRYDVEGAIEHLQKAVEIAPQYMEALNNLGTIYYQRRDYSAAEQYFQQALAEDPEAFAPLVNLGAALLAAGRPEEALKINQRAQEVRPQDALANAQLGLNYFLVGEDDEAIRFLDRTKELDPAHFSNPQISLARIYLQRSEPEAALRELEDFLERHPDSPNAAEVREMIEQIQHAESSSGTPRLTL